MRRRVTWIGLDCLSERGQRFVVIEVVPSLYSLRPKRDRRRAVGGRRSLESGLGDDSKANGCHEPAMHEAIHTVA